MIRLSSLENNRQINLFAMGHIHQHITRTLGNSLILYTGATEHFDFGEAENETGFCYVEVEGKKMKVEHIKTKSQPMKQLKLHTSKFTVQNPTETILKALVGASDSSGMLQLLLEGEMRFEEYLKINFPRLFDEGKRRNFYYESLDKIKLITESVKFQSSDDLNPRNELISVANQAIKKVDSNEKKFWERALELAVSYYDRYAEA